MNFLVIQHAEHIEPGYIVDWLKTRGHRYTTQEAWLTNEWPAISEFDALIIMGGPMSVYEEEKYPFLKEEKRFINEFISSKKQVFGICLGHQLVAEILGGKVQKGNKEIGWHEVTLTSTLPSIDVLPTSLKVFQWHGDVATLPPGATSIGASKANQIQGLSLKNVLSLQFHPEVAKSNIEAMIANDREDLVNGGPFVQSEAELVNQAAKHQAGAKKLLFDILDAHFRWLN